MAEDEGGEVSDSTSEEDIDDWPRYQYGYSSEGTDELMLTLPSGDIDKIRSLLEQGADPNETGALSDAARGGHTDIVNILLDKGADPNKTGALSDAASGGHTDIVKILLDKGADRNMTGALSDAARGGHTDIVKILLDKGADRNMSGALLDAARGGYTDVAKILLDKGADPNKSGALSDAAREGYTDMAKILLDKGADPNKSGALSDAACRSHTDIVKILLDKGADPNKSGPLSDAAYRGDTDIVKLLLDKGADPNKSGVLSDAACRGHTNIVKLLLDKGADPNKSSALSDAACRGHTDIVKLLLDKGADPNKSLALSRAAREGYVDIVKILLDKRADPNQSCALSDAARGGHTDIVKILLDKGADRNMSDAFSNAAHGGYIDIVKILLDKGADRNESGALSEAARGGHTNIVKILLDKRADRNMSGALSGAAYAGHTDIVKLLLDKGADPNESSALSNAALGGYTDIVKILLDKEVDPNEYRALYDAVGGGHTDIVKLLLDKGADPNKYPALSDAVRGCYTDIVKILLDKGADPNKSGALSDAARRGQTDIVQLLLEKGADPNESGALRVAAQEGHTDIVKLLLDKGANPEEGRAMQVAKQYGRKIIVEILKNWQVKQIGSTGYELTQKTVPLTLDPKCKAKTDPEWIVEIAKKQNIEDFKMLEKDFTANQINSFGVPHIVAVYGSSEMIDCMMEWKGIEWNEQCKISENIFGESLIGLGVSKATALYVATYMDKTDIARSLIKCAREDTIRYCFQNLDLSIQMEEVFMLNIAEKVKQKHSELKPAVITGHRVEDEKRERVFIVYSKHVGEASQYQLDGIGLVMIRNPYLFAKENGCNTDVQVTVSDEDSKRAQKAISIHRDNLWKNHSNLNIISVSPVIYRNNGADIINKTCIVLHCSTKGVVPLGEPEFPTQLYIGEDDSIDVDVHEGYFKRGAYSSLPSNVPHTRLKMGCNIGRLTPEYDAHGNPLQNISGTQGPFVAFNNKIGFLTCAHVLFDIPMTKQSVDFQHTGNTKIEVVQPSVDATTSNGVACGHVYRAIFNPQLIPSVDVAVVELTDFNRIPSKGQFSNAYRSSYLDAGFAELPEYNSGSVQTDLQQISSSQTLVKFGSSSDVTRGTLRVCGVDVRQMTTPLGLPRDRGQAQMINQYQVCGSYPSLQFFLDGDSGSAVFMNTPKTNDLQLIGMAIGCTYVEKSPFFAAVVTPIDAILSALGPQYSIASFS